MFEQMPFSEKYPVFRKLAEIGDLRKLSREELELYDEDIKNMRDIYATRKFDEKRGMEIGMKKGMEKGMAKEKLATVYRLLSMGLSDEQVSTATELPLEEILKLKEQAWNWLNFQELKCRIWDVFINHIQNFRMWFKFGLKAQKLLAQGIALDNHGRKPVALQGQKLQRIRLG